MTATGIYRPQKLRCGDYKAILKLDMSKPLSFQIISDLHLESHPSYNHFEFKQTAPYLALLGDIGHVGNEQLFAFLERQARRYDIVFYLMGNNEAFGLSMSAAKTRVAAFALKMSRMRETCQSYGRFVFLDQTRFDINERTTILGCTLFSKILPEEASAVSARMGDFRYIKDWDVRRHNESHSTDLAWLNEQVRSISHAEPWRNIVIFTHHSPTLSERASTPKNRGSGITSGFCTDLRGEHCWDSDSVSLWAFGHTHFNCDFHDGGKRVVANQKGSFSSSQSTFEPSKIFAIGLEGP